MAQFPLYDSRFRNLFAACWVLWILLYMQVLIWYGFSFPAALIDSGISNGILISSCLLIATILRYYLPQKRRYSYIMGLCAIITTLWFFLSRTLLFFALTNVTYEPFFSNSVIVRLAFAFLIISCMTLISVLWYTLGDRQEADKRRRDAEKLAKEAELYNLRQQLQPHFLFNSLNSINALVKLNPTLARTMIQQLSDFLRGTIHREENGWTKLDEELHHLSLYLDIEKVRFGHRLHTEIIKETSEAYLPAMLLQPIVENAIKFGLYDTTGEVTIRISAKVMNNNLELQVSNPFDIETSSANRGTGFGLSSVNRRLYLLFGRSDLLQTQTTGNQFITTLKIPQRDQSYTDR
ncbi:MAG TPA: histidine kinase [Chitinophagaceae bacterium]|nr:histidine kinase [Chitinophagaceae bacterium]